MVGRQRSGSQCNHCGARTSLTICNACICKGCDRLFVLCECELASLQKQFAKKPETFSDMPRASVAHTSRIRGAQSQKRDTTQTLDDCKTSVIVPHRDAETNQKQLASHRYLNAPGSQASCTHPLDPASRPLVRAGFFMGLHRD